MNPNSTDQLSSLLEDEERQKSGGTASQLQAKRKRQLNSDNSIPSVAAVSTLSSSSSSSSSADNDYLSCAAPRYPKRTRVPSNAENTSNDGAAPAAPAPTTANQSSTSPHISSFVGPASVPFVSTSDFVRPSTGSSCENVATSTDHEVVCQSIVSVSSAFSHSSPRTNEIGTRPTSTAAGCMPNPVGRSVPATLGSDGGKSVSQIFISIDSRDSTATSSDGGGLCSNGDTSIISGGRSPVSVASIPTNPYSAESKSKNDPFMCPVDGPDDLHNQLLDIECEVVPVTCKYLWNSNAATHERYKKENLRARREAFQQYLSIDIANRVFSELKESCSGDCTSLTMDHLMDRTLNELESVALALSKSVDAYRSISNKNKSELAEGILQSFQDFDAEWVLPRFDPAKFKLKDLDEIPEILEEKTETAMILRPKVEHLPKILQLLQRSFMGEMKVSFLL